jgi:hypothetical protein
MFNIFMFKNFLLISAFPYISNINDCQSHPLCIGHKFPSLHSPLNP